MYLFVKYFFFDKEHTCMGVVVVVLPASFFVCVLSKKFFCFSAQLFCLYGHLSLPIDICETQAKSPDCRVCTSDPKYHRDIDSRPNRSTSSTVSDSTIATATTTTYGQSGLTKNCQRACCEK